MVPSRVASQTRSPPTPLRVFPLLPSFRNAPLGSECNSFEFRSELLRFAYPGSDEVLDELALFSQQEFAQETLKEQYGE